MLGVTYKSAWFMTHRIREAMKPEGARLLGSGGGTVEADETYWGNNGKRRKGARGYAHKMKVVSLVERGGKKRSIVVKEVNVRSMTALLESNVCKTAYLMTDEHSSYTPVGRPTLRAASPSTARSNTPWAKSTATPLNRLSAQARPDRHVPPCGRKALAARRHRVDFRWNTRTKMGYTDVERAQLALKCIAGKRLM